MNKLKILFKTESTNELVKSLLPGYHKILHEILGTYYSFIWSISNNYTDKNVVVGIIRIWLSSLYVKWII